MQTLLTSNCFDDILRVPLASENYVYRVTRRDDNAPIWDIGGDVRGYKKEEEAYEVSGDTLKWAGIKLSTRYSGSGYQTGMRVMPDFSSRLYIIKKL